MHRQVWSASSSCWLCQLTSFFQLHRAKRENATSAASFKKRGDEMKHSLVTLPQSSSSASTALESQCCKQGTEGFGFCHAGVEVSGLWKEGSFPHVPAGSLQSCELPHRFQSHLVLYQYYLDWPGCVQSFAGLFHLQLSPGDH